MNDPLAFNGRRIKVRGRAVSMTFRYEIRDGKIGRRSVGSDVCTLALCGPKAPCCNKCHNAVSLSDPTAPGGLTLVRRGYGCKGTNCSMQCKPAEGRSYEVVGTVSMGTVGFTELKLKVESIRRLK